MQASRTSTDFKVGISTDMMKLKRIRNSCTLTFNIYLKNCNLYISVFSPGRTDLKRQKDILVFL